MFGYFEIFRLSDLIYIRNLFRTNQYSIITYNAINKLLEKLCFDNGTLCYYIQQLQAPYLEHNNCKRYDCIFNCCITHLAVGVVVLAIKGISR